MSRKYRQPGYQDKPEKEPHKRSTPRSFREGPRSPRMAAFQEVLRCAECGAKLPPSFTEIGWESRCERCGADLHTCKNCSYFDPGSRFECTQPIPQRIPRKDKANRCEFFEAKTTVEKEVTSSQERALDPREAFERLFKK